MEITAPRISIFPNSTQAGNQPINKVQAAKLLNEVDGNGICIYETEEGWTQNSRYITVSSRYQGFGDIQPPSLNAASINGDKADAHCYGQMMVLGAEVMDLADMLLIA